MQSFSSPRVFAPWAYTISHSQLLVRSSKYENFLENIDLKFLDVQYMDIPVTLIGLRLDNANDEDLEYLASRVDNLTNYTIYVLCSQKRRHYVVAYGLNISSNTLKVRETGF